MLVNVAEYASLYYSLVGGIHLKFSISKDQRLCMVPDDAAAGDIICVLFGAQTPYVLRPYKKNAFRLVGECYVHGIMEGQALTQFERKSYKRQKFKIW